VALKLNTTYGYSYNNLKVLFGGWSAWKAANYPMIVATPDPNPPTVVPSKGGAIPLNGTPGQLPPGVLIVTPKP